MKRKFGEVINARIYRLQVKEIKIKVILYNLTRLITTSLGQLNIWVELEITLSKYVL